MLFIKPAPGLVIPDPDRRDLLPAEGRAVPHSDFWLRRLRDGDVLPTTEAEITAAAPGAEAMTAPEQG